MMDRESQLQLQALLDRELSGEEAQRVEARLAQDAEAVALLAELKGAREAFKVFEQEVKLPESREFFWSKVEREIRRRERMDQPPEPATPAWWTAWRRLLLPATAVAALAVAALIGWPGKSGTPQFESAVADAGAFTYRDFNTGTTLVWLSYPAEHVLPEPEPDSILQ